MINSTSLFLIGDRVTHFLGDSGTHGTGTVVGYNHTKPNAYLAEKPKDAAALAAQAGLLGALVGSFYDGNRYPYVVRWDPSSKYPMGYKDVYEPTSIRQLDPPQNIFLDLEKKGFDANMAARRWCKGDAGWTQWQACDKSFYYRFKDDGAFEFITRDSPPKTKYNNLKPSDHPMDPSLQSGIPPKTMPDVDLDLKKHLQRFESAAAKVGYDLTRVPGSNYVQPETQKAWRLYLQTQGLLDIYDSWAAYLDKK